MLSKRFKRLAKDANFIVDFYDEEIRKFGKHRERARKNAFRAQLAHAEGAALGARKVRAILDVFAEELEVFDRILVEQVGEEKAKEIMKEVACALSK